MASELHEFLTRDHERLDALLAAALRSDGSIDQESYVEFRRGLLWHIGVEEKLLFPIIRKRGADPAVMQQLHREHAALGALLMPPPTAAEIESIRSILSGHNPLEEESGGMYEVVESLAGDELAELMSRVRAMPPVVLAGHADTEVTRSSIAQLLKDVEEGKRKLRQQHQSP